MRWVAVIVIGFSVLFLTKVYADSGVISPLADTFEPPAENVRVVSASTGSPDVLGVQSSLSDAITRFAVATPTPAPADTAPLPSPTPAPRKSRKSQMTVSLLGDSMMDTLGPDGGGLAKRLAAVYPATTITVINHGVGGENIDTGLNHLTNGYQYLGAVRPSVRTLPIPGRPGSGVIRIQPVSV